ncbi:amidohydrolase family protein [Ferroplasma acidarmanus]|uniref:N-ethylammeline chlorohydrolase n=1 Tax=Ferroplasma acidarmanus Fer1 TaxID=333146 RepID=S0AMN3_FERAC|nr:N-ethylammeline chlorohydrolase [Ferroplasma acidarmanus]AGO60256.1 hypothetical protein FACI_IFERC00001G0276 [Ferroplasma acidarmanus Fer1]
MEFSGNIYYNGKLRRGTLKVDDTGEIYSNKTGNMNHGTLIPMPVNAHTHVGDSFINEEPKGTLPEIVGPDGLKHRFLDNADDNEVINYISKTNNFMEKNGIISYFDFRENGLKGINMIKRGNKKFIKPVIFARPYNNDDIDKIIANSNGIGISSISDMDYNDIYDISIKTHKKNKIFALHFSENINEDIDKVMNLKPDLLIHGIESNDNDLDKISKNNVSIVITPRSNIFYGKRPDYNKFLKHNINLMLGTDNVFVTEPDIFSEMDFLYRYQRFLNYVSPENILKMVIDNPYTFLKNNNIKIKKRYLFFKNELLNEYQIVTKKHYFKPVKIL